MYRGSGGPVAAVGLDPPADPKVGRNRLSVLALGESCRREEPVARAIHAANLRGQFVLLGGGPPARAGNLTCGREIPNRLEEGKSR